MIYYREHGQKAYDLIKEAKQGKLINSDYNTNNSDYVTNTYETDKAIYKIIDNLEYGTLYSVEKIVKQ
jgi:hypothetical protein